MLSVREPYPDEIIATQAHDAFAWTVFARDVLDKEIERVGATHAELLAAQAFNASDAGFDPRVYDKLSPRTRRLVDLLAVAGPCGRSASVDAIRVDAMD